MGHTPAALNSDPPLRFWPIILQNSGGKLENDLLWIYKLVPDITDSLFLTSDAELWVRRVASLQWLWI